MKKNHLSSHVCFNIHKTSFFSYVSFRLVQAILTPKFYSIQTLFFCLIFCSCSEDESITSKLTSKTDSENIQVVKLPSLKGLAVDGQEYENATLLRFRNNAVFQETLYLLESMTREEREIWNKQFANFKSMDQLYIQAMEEAENLTFTEQEYNNYKKKYSQILYFPQYKDDFGGYVSLRQRNFAYIANANGCYMIEDEVIKAPRIENYTQLQESGQGLYENTNLQPHSASASGLKNSWMEEVGINDIYAGSLESIWYIAGRDNGKRIKFRVSRLIVPQPTSLVGRPYLTGAEAKLEVRIAFRKKGFLGAWYNYSSETSTTMKFSINNVERFQKEGYSDHNWTSPKYLETDSKDPIAKKVYYGCLPFDLTTDYRGIGVIKWSGSLPPVVVRYTGY